MKAILLLTLVTTFTMRLFAQKECCKTERATTESLSTNSAGVEQKALQTGNVTGISRNNVSFYRVPLVCPAAPEIGCGVQAKPILKELEQQESVSQAWLNREGTILAVVWDARSSRKLREQVVSSTCDRETLTVTELKSDEFQRTFQSFTSGVGWYRAASVDRLSEREAEVIVDRLIRRTKARVSLSDEKVGQMKSVLSTICKEQLIDKTKKDRKILEAELLEPVRNLLSEEEAAALKEAIALGFRPLPDEK